MCATVGFGGVTALGFGIELTFETVPDQVVGAADDLDLPLLEVRLATPFFVVTKTVADRLARLATAVSRVVNAARVAWQDD